MDSDNDIGGLMRQNWPLLVTIGVLLGGAGFVYLRGSAEGPIPTADAAVVVPGQATVVTAAAQSERRVRKTPQEMAVEQIAEHEAKVEADDENTPAYLAAMGNLYRQKLVDYEKAAECYERLLVDHADWDGVRVVYMQLATCYERLDRTEDAKRVYEKMLKVFPADSQEHELAYAAVYR